MKVEVMQTWKSHTVPPRYTRFVASVQEKNPEYQYTLLDDNDFDLMIKTEVPQWYEFWKQLRVGIERIDFARYIWMATFTGADMGIYLDMDILCLKSFDPLLEAKQLVLGLEPKEHFSKPTLCNAVLISPPGHPFWMELCQDIVDRYHSIWFNIDPVNTTGPTALTRFYNSKWDKDRYQLRIMSPAAFFPMTDCHNPGHQIDGFDSISAEVQDLSQTYCIHIWGHTWIPSWIVCLQPISTWWRQWRTCILVMCFLVGLCFLLFRQPRWR